MAVAALLFAVPIRCACAVPAPDCRVAGTQTARVAAVTDDFELALGDGRSLRLAGIDPARPTADRPTLGADARGTLARLVLGRDVTFVPLAPPDRWNRIAALVFAPGAEGSASVAAALVEVGSARVRPEPGTHGCMTDLFAREEAARTAGRGLWQDPVYAVADPNDAAALGARRGTLVLVEGLLRLRRGRAGDLVLLGSPGTPFSARVPRRAAKAFARAGIDLADFVGTPVRLRGVLDDRFGPRIDLEDPDQLESLEPGSIAPGAASPGSRAAPDPP